MKKCVVIGSSVAAINAVEILAEKSNDYTFSVISLDGAYPADRDRFHELINKQIKLSDNHIKPEAYYSDNKIEVITDKKLDRINFNKGIIFTAEKEKIEYDILLIADFPNEKWSENIKGTNKNNVYSLTKAKPLFDVYEALPILESIAVESQTVNGFLLACAFAAQTKETALITRDETLLPRLFSPEAFEAIKAFWFERHLSIETNNEIVEILGEGDGKAVKLKTGKVFAADATFLADVVSDPKFAENKALNIASRISVDGQFKTSIDNVFALDIASHEAFKRAEELLADGAQVAASLLGEEAQASIELSERQLSVDGFNITVLGDPDALGETSDKTVFDADQLSYKRILIEGDQPKAAVLINAPESVEAFRRVLNGEADVESIEDQFSAPAQEAVAAPVPTQEEGGLAEGDPSEAPAADVQSEEAPETAEVRENKQEGTN